MDWDVCCAVAAEGQRDGGGRRGKEAFDKRRKTITLEFMSHIMVMAGTATNLRPRRKQFWLQVETQMFNVSICMYL